MITYLAQKTQIDLLSIEKLFKNILARYLDFANMFSREFVVKLLEYLSISKYAMNFEENKQLPYKSIE